MAVRFLDMSARELACFDFHSKIFNFTPKAFVMNLADLPDYLPKAEPVRDTLNVTIFTIKQRYLWVQFSLEASSICGR